jgi:hypothetical protein
MIGINVRTDKGAGVDYAGAILAGEKTLESRATDSLRPWVGQRVAIVRTGVGRAHAIGTVRIVAGWKVPAPIFRMLEPHHLVPQYSQFDVPRGGDKWVYLLAEPHPFELAHAVANGVVARQVLGPLPSVPHVPIWRHGRERGF